MTTYSHSRLASFEDCPRKFKYRYVLKIPTNTEGIEGYVGKVVHDVLERLYIAAREGRVPSFPQVIGLSSSFNRSLGPRTRTSKPTAAR